MLALIAHLLIQQMQSTISILLEFDEEEINPSFQLCFGFRHLLRQISVPFAAHCIPYMFTC